MIELPVKIITHHFRSRFIRHAAFIDTNRRKAEAICANVVATIELAVGLGVHVRINTWEVGSLSFFFLRKFFYMNWYFCACARTIRNLFRNVLPANLPQSTGNTFCKSPASFAQDVFAFCEVKANHLTTRLTEET